MKTTTPSLAVKEITDIYLRQNFLSLTNYFQAQNQLLDFKFFDIEFTESGSRKVAHGLTYAPEDIIVTKITGIGAVTFNYSAFDSTNIELEATGPARVRFFVGRYWQSGASPSNGEDIYTVQATPSSGSSSASSTSTTFLPAPVTTVYRTTGAGTWTAIFAFQCAVASVTAGATYQVNGVTYTVSSTLTDATTVFLSGTVMPPASGILQKTGGAGDDRVTYTAMKAPVYLEVEVVGAGGSGAPSTSGAAIQGVTGGTSTFGSNPTLITCAGGEQGFINGTWGGSGGIYSFNAPMIEIIGCYGGSGDGCHPGGSYQSGGIGGASFYCGGGSAGGGTNAGAFGRQPTDLSSGAGGGGACYIGAGFGGSGGGAGAFFKGRLYNPSLSYPFSIGAGGVGVGGSGPGAAGTQQGANGRVTVTAFYQ